MYYCKGENVKTQVTIGDLPYAQKVDRKYI